MCKAEIVPDGQEAQVPQVQDEQERPTIFLHFLHPGNCSMRCSRLLLLAQLYLLLPWSRTFLRLTTREGGNAKGLLGTILAL